MKAVIDASTVGALVLPDEMGASFERIIQLMSDIEFVQPSHWPIEITGLVLKACRRNRVTPIERSSIREMIAMLIKSAEIESKSAALVAFDLAIKHHISVYDAAYLELAIRRGLPLMTGDGALSKALPKAGVERVSLL
jgi:predicted nucleic acid-binding protein